MKTVFLFFFFSVTATVSHAHEYFFAFAELDYNAATRRFEITVEGSAHDVEDALQDSGILIEELENHTHDSLMLDVLERFLTKGLQITSGTAAAKLHLVGMEVKPNGLVYFYLSSEPMDISGKIDLTFDWLMDQFPEQQNKITLRYNEHKYTAVFMPQRRRETIQL